MGRLTAESWRRARPRDVSHLPSPLTSEYLGTLTVDVGEPCENGPLTAEGHVRPDVPGQAAGPERGAHEVYVQLRRS
jgi:hypothetical protein